MLMDPLLPPLLSQKRERGEKRESVEKLGFSGCLPSFPLVGATERRRNFFLISKSLRDQDSLANTKKFSLFHVSSSYYSLFSKYKLELFPP